MASLLDRHLESLATSSRLSGYYVKNAILPHEIIGLLNGAGISFVLIGAHSLGGWTRQPRTTEDVDVVVAARHLKKATQTILKAFPHLKPEDGEAAVRFHDADSEKVLIDIVKPRAFYREVFKHSEKITRKGQTYRIPSLEMSLALKWSAMLNRHRPDAKKHYDAGDFINMVKANAEIDLETLAKLGEVVFGGGGKDIVDKVRKVRAGEKLVL